MKKKGVSPYASVIIEGVFYSAGAGLMAGHWNVAVGLVVFVMGILLSVYVASL